jgi:hypothetical protein
LKIFFSLKLRSSREGYLFLLFEIVGVNAIAQDGYKAKRDHVGENDFNRDRGDSNIGACADEHEYWSGNKQEVPYLLAYFAGLFSHRCLPAA